MHACQSSYYVHYSKLESLYSQFVQLGVVLVGDITLVEL